jgi:hypothetical protein
LTKVKPSFTFQNTTAFAGSPASFQLSLHSHTRNSASPIIFSSARLTFNEQIPDIVLTHHTAESPKLQKFGLNETTATVDMSLQSGQVKVFEFYYTPVAEALIEVSLLGIR